MEVRNPYHSPTFVTLLLFGKLVTTYAVYTEVPEIQDEQHSKRTAPPHTAHMPRSNLLIFWREAPQRYPLRGIGAIFEFRPTSGDKGV